MLPGLITHRLNKPDSVRFFSFLQKAAATLLLASPLMAQAGTLAVATVRSSAGAGAYSADAVVEAVRQTVISAQVSGAIVALPVKAGDVVKAGQPLLRIDARAALQEASASRAQVEAARASLVVAAKDFERQKQLFARQYISQANLDRAESQYQTSSAQAKAQIAQAGAAQTQSGFYVLSAPYAGIVADVPVTLGDMALPGRPLMTVYDPGNLRVTASVPQARVAALLAALTLGQDTAQAVLKTVKIEFPHLPPEQRWVSAVKVTVLPVADAATHTVQVRLDLPPGISDITPGMFARASLPLDESSKTGSGTGDKNAQIKGETVRFFVPVKALFRRAEVSAVYVVNARGKPVMRQVKAGRVTGDEQEILSGVSGGEQVALDPVAAAQIR